VYSLGQRQRPKHVKDFARFSDSPVYAALVDLSMPSAQEVKFNLFFIPSLPLAGEMVVGRSKIG